MQIKIKPKKKAPAPKVNHNIFWWLTSLILSACLALVSWSFFTKIYQLPELPSHYKLLKKFNQLKDPVELSYEDIRSMGTSINVEEFQDKFHNLELHHLSYLNQTFIRNHLRCYQHPEEVLFIEGRFRIKSILKCSENNLITEGFRIQLESLFHSEVLRETKPYPFYVNIYYPASTLPEALKVGKEWTLSKRKQGLVIIQIQEFKGSRSTWHLDTLPLLNKGFELPNGRLAKFSPTNAFNL